MSSLISAVTGNAPISILLEHVNDIRELLNGTTAYKVKLIHNDDDAFIVVPDTSGFTATNDWLVLYHTDGTTKRLGIKYNGVIDSDVATGTAPLEIASTTVVTNLNADTTDGLHLQSAGTGSLVATGGAATLTDKTLTAPTIADFTNAAHDHGDADDGGTLTDGAIGLTTAGDIVYSDGTSPTRLAIGTATQLLRTNAGATAPEWAARATAIALTTEGDIVYHGASDLGRLAIGSAGYVLRVNSGATAPEWSATDFIDPWTIDIDVFITAKANTNWSTLTIGAGSGELVYNAYKNSTGAQNAEISWDVVLSAGTWTVYVMYVANTDAGIMSVQFDDVAKGTIDTYNGSFSGSQIGSVSGIAVATAAKIELSLKMLTKNASSSSYAGNIQHIRLLRTA